MIQLRISGTGRRIYTGALYMYGFCQGREVSVLISELGCMMDGVGHWIGLAQALSGGTG